MLTPSDLKAIGEVVEAKIESTVPRIIDEKVPPIVEKIVHEKLDVVLEAVQEQLDTIENKMVTKSDMESYEVRLTERYDKRYVRLNPAS